jgi:2-C-methyl-D-erythritol 2,4-cyclodiphosphate synthase
MRQSAAAGAARAAGTTTGAVNSAAESAGTAGERPLLLGGVRFDGAPPLEGNSDADVVLHALTNAISGITGVNVLGETADRMCRELGITDSAAYVREAMGSLGANRIVHLSFSIECARPPISRKIRAMRESIARITGVAPDSIGITATSGEGLTAFGRGRGIQVFCVVTCETIDGAK